MSDDCVNLEELSRCWYILLSRVDNLERSVALMEKTIDKPCSLKDKILDPELISLLETSQGILANTYKHLQEATEGEFRTDKLKHDEESRKYYSGMAWKEVEEVEENLKKAIDIVVSIRKEMLANEIYEYRGGGCE